MSGLDPSTAMAPPRSSAVQPSMSTWNSVGESPVTATPSIAMPPPSSGAVALTTVQSSILTSLLRMRMAPPSDDPVTVPFMAWPFTSRKPLMTCRRPGDPTGQKSPTTMQRPSVRKGAVDASMTAWPPLLTAWMRMSSSPFGTAKGRYVPGQTRIVSPGIAMASAKLMSVAVGPQFIVPAGGLTQIVCGTWADAALERASAPARANAERGMERSRKRDASMIVGSRGRSFRTPCHLRSLRGRHARAHTAPRLQQRSLRRTEFRPTPESAAHGRAGPRRCDPVPGVRSVSNP